MKVAILLLIPGLYATNVSVAWTASTTPNVTYNVYRAKATCASATTFSKINTTAITTVNYLDPNVAVGTYCYYATAFLTNASPQESVPSNKGEVTIASQPNPPTNFTIEPVSTTVRIGEQFQFHVVPETSVDWSIHGVGTITSEGLYTAPNKLQGNNVDVEVIARKDLIRQIAVVTVTKK